MAIRIVKNVAADDLTGIEAIMLRSGATSVSATLEGDGEYTVTGIFPDIESHAALKARVEAFG